MNGIGHVNASAFQHTGHLPQGVLSLCHGEAVARNNDHPLRSFKGEGTFLSTAAGDVGVLTAAATASGGRAKGAAEQNGHQRTVHAITHHLGEDQSGSSDHGSSHDQQLTSDNEARRRRRDSRITVEQGDDHRHVGTTDRQGHPDAEQTGANYQQPQALGTFAGCNQLDRCHEREHRQGDVHGMAQAALHPGRSGQPTLELGHGHDRAGEGDRSDENRDND